MSPDEEDFSETARRLRGGERILGEAVKRELELLAVPRKRAESLLEPGKDWYVIRVEVTSGRGERFNPPPGRDFLVSPQHTFRQLADAINAGFARWDLGHLYVFRLPDGSRVGTAFEDSSERAAARTKVAKRLEGEVFDYEFDFGDSWEHRCTVLETGVVPEDVYGVRPKGPVAVWGWGMIPDQYGRTTPGG
ncbi:MAG: IS1096 element passenger TnpR family protein [Actinomycetota bacterium]